MLIPAALLAAVATAVRLWFRPKRADVLLFLTHTPNAYHPGTVHGENVITRLVQVAPTSLINGGLAPCWGVYGIHNAN